MYLSIPKMYKTLSYYNPHQYSYSIMHRVHQKVRMDSKLNLVGDRMTNRTGGTEK